MARLGKQYLIAGQMFTKMRFTNLIANIESQMSAVCLNYYWRGKGIRSEVLVKITMIEMGLEAALATYTLS